MSLAERKYTTIEREVLAVVYAYKKFRHYLLEYQIVFHIDHNSLKYLVNKPNLSGKIARWMLLLQEFNYEVVVKSGKSNVNADFLLRYQGTRALKSVSIEFLDNKKVAVFYSNGEDGSELQDIINYLKE